MKQVNTKINNLGRNGIPWNETFVVPDNEDPKIAIQRQLDEFNRIERQRYGENAQIRILVEICNEDQEDQIACEFEKSGMEGIYDVYQCKRCKLVFKRFGLSGPPRTKLCHPERVCIPCNKEFISIQNALKHKTIHSRDKYGKTRLVGEDMK